MHHDNEPRVVLLLGAGASFGARKLKDDGTPPLGKALMCRLRSSFAESWGSMNDPPLQAFTPNFEIGMDRLYERVEAGEVKNLTQLQKDMGRFFSIFCIDDPETHLYSRLARAYPKELLSKKLSLITLNYDCLLERAILGEGIALTYGDGPGAELVKPHGSCNFIADFPNLTTEQDVIFAGGWVDCDMKILNPLSVDDIAKGIQNSRFPPVMSIYAKNKNNIVCKRVIEKFVKKAQKRILGAERLIIIGASPNTNDHHIWGPINETNAELIFVTKRDDCCSWIRENRPDAVHLGDEFQIAFEKLREDIDLSLLG